MSRLFTPVPPVSPARRGEVVAELDQVAAINRDYLVLVVRSCLIASFGLVLNSVAVILGAMLIAPLMPPILAFALWLIRTDLDQVWRALAMLTVGFLLAVALSTLLGRGVSGTTFHCLAELPARSPTSSVVAPRRTGTL